MAYMVCILTKSLTLHVRVYGPEFRVQGLLRNRGMENKYPSR